jgi:hypothetical protein
MPPPQIESLEAWLARVPAHKRKSAAELRQLAGRDEE